jgi:hypothetical protein
MADDRYEQLYQIRQQAAHQRLVQGLETQRQANYQDYCQAIAENDVNAAGFAESEYRKNTRELAEMTGAQVVQPQQQQQQPQGQQLNSEQMEWINRNPAVWGDPRKRAELIAAHNSLMDRGYKPYGPEYFSSLELAIGLTGPDGKEGNEIISPNQVVEICKITPEQYNEGAARLAEMKRQGFYKAE